MGAAMKGTDVSEHQDETAGTEEVLVPVQPFPPFPPLGTTTSAKVDTHGQVVPPTPADPGAPAIAKVEEARDTDTVAADTVSAEDVLADAVIELVGQTKRFHERAAAQEETIRQLHARVEELQTDQVRTLLKPVIQKLAALHAQAGEAAERAGSAGELAERDLSYFAVALEDSLGLLDIESVGAAPGAAFDATRHHAVQVAPTDRPELDRTIARVLRQGFTYTGAARVLLPAQVVIHRHEPAAAS